MAAHFTICRLKRRPDPRQSAHKGPERTPFSDSRVRLSISTDRLQHRTTQSYDWYGSPPISGLGAQASGLRFQVPAFRSAAASTSPLHLKPTPQTTRHRPSAIVFLLAPCSLPLSPTTFPHARLLRPIYGLIASASKGFAERKPLEASGPMVAIHQASGRVASQRQSSRSGLVLSEPALDARTVCTGVWFYL